MPENPPGNPFTKGKYTSFKTDKKCKCGAEMVGKRTDSPSTKQLSKAYYYKYTFTCPACRKLFVFPEHIVRSQELPFISEKDL